MSNKKMKYSKFRSLSVKARATLVQEYFFREGYDIYVTGKFDKLTKTLIKSLQKRNGLTPNCVICEKTYNLLDIRESNHFDIISE